MVETSKQLTLIQDLEVRKAKIEQAIQLLREAGLADFQIGSLQSIEAGAQRYRPGIRGKQSAEAKAKISEKMKQRWAEKKSEGKLMNPHQIPRKPASSAT